MSDSVDERIKFLSAEITRHSELYYNHSAPEISDSEFDLLWEELKKYGREPEMVLSILTLVHRPRLSP